MQNTKAQKFVEFIQSLPAGTSGWDKKGEEGWATYLIHHEAEYLGTIRAPSEFDSDMDHAIALPENARSTECDFRLHQFNDNSMVIEVYTPGEIYISLFGLQNGKMAEIEFVNPSGKIFDKTNPDEFVINDIESRLEMVDGKPNIVLYFSEMDLDYTDSMISTLFNFVHRIQTKKSDNETILLLNMPIEKLLDRFIDHHAAFDSHEKGSLHFDEADRDIINNTIHGFKALIARLETASFETK